MDGFVITLFALATFVAFAVISILQAVAGSITTDTLTLYVLGVPFMTAGLWSGPSLFGTINDETLRKGMVWFLLLSGLSLMASAFGFGPLTLDAFPPSAPPV
jgi:hypothetical protein